MRLKKFNDEVLYAEGPVVTLGPEELELLKESASGNERGRMRICTHPNTEDTLHEMFIAIQQGAYIRPHKHLGKSESFFVIEGSVDVILFDENGKITEINSIADRVSGGIFYHRISEAFFHTLVIKSDHLVFHEITNGPFNPEDTEYASWSPTEDDSSRVNDYQANLAESIKQFVSQKSHDPAASEGAR